jgi:hypothetical protein
MGRESFLWRSCPFRLVEFEHRRIEDWLISILVGVFSVMTRRPLVRCGKSQPAMARRGSGAHHAICA